MHIRSTILALTAGAAAAAALSATGARADEAACSALAASGLFADTTVSAARMVPSGPMTAGAGGPPGAAGGPPLPAFCEVTAEISPEEGSHIGVVYRLPDTWNGKVLGLGGGGFSGNVSLAGAADGLLRGYATMQTDTGHPIPAGPAGAFDASWLANGEHEFDWPALEDFGNRGLHLMTVIGKQVADRYYGRPHDHAYYQGCSTGGRQGFMEVQRYPTDYEGVVAGSPVFDVSIQTSAIIRGRLFADPEARLSQAQAARLAAAATAACDPQDGLEDGIVSDPRGCSWDPGALACGGDEPAETCLNPKQIDAVRRMYAGERTDSGDVVGQPGMRGGEASWMFALTGMGDPVVTQENGAAVFLGGFGESADGLTPTEIFERLHSTRFAGYYDAGNPDISAFAEAGGKLIAYHGWMDSLANPPATADYFDAMAATTGPKIDGPVADHARLFMMPGTGHCGGGPGANSADFLSALEAWVEDGRAPDRIVATHAASPFGPPEPADQPAMVRPLCVYPAQARFEGGDPNDPASFACE